MMASGSISTTQSRPNTNNSFNTKPPSLDMGISRNVFGSLTNAKNCRPSSDIEPEPLPKNAVTDATPLAANLHHSQSGCHFSPSEVRVSHLCLWLYTSLSRIPDCFKFTDQSTLPAFMSSFSCSHWDWLFWTTGYYKLHPRKRYQSSWLCVSLQLPIHLSLVFRPRNIWPIQRSCRSRVQVVTISPHVPHSRQNSQQTYQHGLDRPGRVVSPGSAYGLGRATEAQCEATCLSLETNPMVDNTNCRRENGVDSEQGLFSLSIG